MSDDIPNDLEDKIEYLKNQNKFLKEKLEELTRKYKEMEHEFDKVWEENQNLRIVRNAGEVL
jgi:prefoldin subunit 5|tara:strand:- start:625 stop:810 length:186 start_codon:yes stop_codon:yes gene_type:complete